MNAVGITKDFRQLDAKDAMACDRFFERWAPGQSLDKIHMPYERLKAYRDLLSLTRVADPEKYKVAHKGTPFFFIGLSLFDLAH